MALTRKMLKAMGIEDEKIDQIIDAHAETVDNLKSKITAAEEKAAEIDNITKERDDLRKNIADSNEKSSKYDKLKADFDKYKAEVTGKETAAAKTKAVRDYFESKNITGSNLDIALRGCKDEISAIEIKDGKINDTKALDELIAGTYSGLVVKTGTNGASVSTPPSGSVTKGSMTKKDILAIKDAGERQQAIAENAELFGITLSE